MQCFFCGAKNTDYIYYYQDKSTIHRIEGGKIGLNCCNDCNSIDDRYKNRYAAMVLFTNDSRARSLTLREIALIDSMVSARLA